MAVERKIRRSQAVVPFGPGAIYDFGDESLVACDTSMWGNSGVTVRLPRLEALLGVSSFRSAPPMPEMSWQHAETIPFMRFPQWLFCPKCRSLLKWGKADEVSRELPRCRPCSRGRKRGPVLAPMRFVAACANGHLLDVPWQRWAHSKPTRGEEQGCRIISGLQFRPNSIGRDVLSSVMVCCSKCGASRSLAGITAPDSLRSVGWRCSGAHPWQRMEEGCDKTPQVLQRGASNLYYPKIVSALDLDQQGAAENGSVKEAIRSHAAFLYLCNFLASAEGAPEPAKFFAKTIAESLGCDPELVLEAAQDAAGSAAVERAAERSEVDLLEEEWALLNNPPPEEDCLARFSARRTGDVALRDAGLEELFSNVVLVKRLREVRALKEFSRVIPEENPVSPSLGKHVNWLPAAEVFGEGIFVAIREEALQAWRRSGGLDLEKRVAAVCDKADSVGLRFLPDPDERFLLLHTLSHLLIRQLSYECGYASSSLRERIYSSPGGRGGRPMAGVLIFTADSDSEGALGGLVRQGEPERLAPTLRAALSSGEWCSADPVCRELSGQGLGGLNRAACHACSLVSETSCTFGNSLLDRVFVIGSASSGLDPINGFFRGFLDSGDSQ